MAGQQKPIGDQAVPEFLYGTAWKEEKTQSLVEQALGQGFRGIDTANQRKHYVEQAVGRGIAAAVAAKVVRREQLFIQTKYTFQRGQDHRLPYDPKLPISDQVWQSFRSSLEHLQTDYLDSLILHGPSSRNGLLDNDWAAWRGMEAVHGSGRVRFLGISNVALPQLKLLCDKASVKPRFVQNRCYASTGWDREIRQYCLAHDIVYQGFSLLTANQKYLRHPKILDIGKSHGMSISQTIFRFAMDARMIPLTGTSSREHMAHDLLAHDFRLSEAEVAAIETVALNA
ncbi:MAG: aldo/keto reductase [Rhodospirillales bacterium]|nr:aldo/keto reductase [Rhodospirillales bacterium]